MDVDNNCDASDCELVDHTDPTNKDDILYYFESDHVALKSNSDYQNLLRTIALLESQRIQSLKDLDTIHDEQDKALQDPIQFVQQLQNGKQFNFPRAQDVPSLPLIDWEKYTNSVQFNSFSVRHMTRWKKQLVHGTTDEELKSGMSNVIDDSDSRVVRGRVKKDSKPATFNQLWTVEEQKRLEELLVSYPPEEVETKRWQKIATALGNRTVQQVASRVQKYFIKLAKAGLPVPGRVPNLNYHMRKSGHRHHRYNRMYYPSSTFMHAYDPPVYMSDDEDDAKSYAESYDDDTPNNQWSHSPDISDDDDIPCELRNTPEYRQLVQLKMLKKEQLKSEQIIQHIGYKCDNCEREPIMGTRWHCVDCPDSSACDFCENCADCSYESATHNSSHRLKPVYQAGNPIVDQDYTKFTPGGDYNYLDPNYMPAS